ncbi:MAG: LrgB family protein, partial [Acidobacteriota bacterium]|nr:LrgB family protein [Acidobacteriota bacterium]
MSAVLPSVAALLASLPGAMALTLASFAAGQTIQRLSRGHLLVNPVLLAILLVMSVLVWVEIPYPRYFASAAPLHFLLGPATVALAVPLYRHAAAVRAHIPQVLGAMAVGSAVATLVAIAVARALQAAPAILGSLLPKTVTTPV